MLNVLLDVLRNTTVFGYSLVEIIAVVFVFGLIACFLVRILCCTGACLARICRRKHPPVLAPVPAAAVAPRTDGEYSSNDKVAMRPARLVPFTSDWADNGQIPGGIEKILVVDDELLIRDVNKRILESLGYEVFCVPGGPAAIEYLRENDADLMLLDLVMPEMDGLETYRRVKQFKPDQKCVILSAYPRYHKVVEIQSLGGGPYLVKPPGLAELAQTIRAELDRTAATPVNA